MKRTVLLVLVLLVLAIPATTDASGNAAKNGAHEITGVLEGTLTFVPFGPGYFDVDSLGEVSGIVKGLGRSNMFTFHRPAADGSGDVINGLVRIVAASGDIIQGCYEGTTVYGSEPEQLIGSADFVVTGGTGRFWNASGTIHATAYVTMDPDPTNLVWPVTWVLEGIISD